MTDQPTPSAKPNGTAKPVQSPMGHGIPARGPTKHPRNTVVLPVMVEQLARMVESGSTVKEAADKLKIGYSTAQWYLRERRRGAKKTADKTKGKVSKGFRLSPEQIKIINRLLPKMPQITAHEIAKQAKCHISSVYHYRRMAANDEDRPLPTGDAGEGITAALYAEMRDFNRKAWNNCWDSRVELTDAEISAVKTWRRMNAGSS